MANIGWCVLFTVFVGKEKEHEEEEEKEKFYAIDTGNRKGHTQPKRKADWRQFHAFNLKSSFKKQKMCHSILSFPHFNDFHFKRFVNFLSFLGEF